MWVCARCGEKIADELKVCEKCGLRRASDDRNLVAEPPDRPLTEVGFATVMLRLLGLCLVTLGAIAIVTAIGHVAARAYKLGMDKAFDRFSLDFFVYPLGQLIAGTYFLIGGQWIFDKILTPVRRRRHKDSEDLN